MHPADWRLINGDLLDAIPAELARARGNNPARLLAASDWLIRSKHDGRFVAVRTGDRIIPMHRGALSPAVKDELALLAEADRNPGAHRSLDELLDALHRLDIDEGYGARSGLALVAEPTVLHFAGRDRYRRPLWLTRDTAESWRRMRVAARVDSVQLEAISGYRSHSYQMGIFRRKLARGLSIAEILQVNAAPGYSEHHSGTAMDIGTPGEPAAEESFEQTPAFAWLQSNAGAFGFLMSYPRNNRHGIVYEPWHWRYDGPSS